MMADVQKGFLIRDAWRKGKAPFCLLPMLGIAAAIWGRADPLGMVEQKGGKGSGHRGSCQSLINQL